MTDAVPRPFEPAGDSGEARLQALQDLAELLTDAASEDELFQKALDLLASALGLPCLGLSTLDPFQRMRFRASRGLSDMFLATGEQCCPWPMDATAAHPVLVEDLDQVPGAAPWMLELLAEGIRSLAFIPLLDHGSLVGALLLGSPVRRSFTQAEVRFATAVGRLLGFAVARVRREHAMAGTVAFSERLLETANILVVGLDREGRVVIFNETAERTTGYRKAEVLVPHGFELVVPRERCPAAWAHFRELLEPDPRNLEAETPLLTKEGEERLVSWRSSVFHEPEAKVATLSFGVDITEVRRASEALRASEERFSRIFHMSPDAIDLTRLEDGVSLDCNPSYVKLTGFSREEIVGHSTLPGDLGVWISKADRDRHIAELLARGEVYGMETPLRRKDGSIYIALISSALLEINGQPCNLTLARDITERKRAEEALRTSEEKFSKTFRLSPDSININRLKDGVYLDVNKGFTDIIGYSAEEVIGRSSLPGDLSIWVNGEDRERMAATLRTRGEVVGLEAPFRRKDGTILVGMMSARLIELGGEACILSITRDITERKRAEEALREGSQRLQLALASGNLGIWDRNLLDDTEIWDDRMYELYGIEPGSMVPNYETWLSRIVHREDAVWIPESLQAALGGERPYDLKFRILRPDGSVRHIKSNGVVIRNEQGKAVRVIGINRDRTEQVEAEAERRRLQAEVHHAEKLESLGSLAGGVAHDMNNVLTAILVMAETLRERCGDGHPMARPLDTILHAGQRGRDLVKALTDFARKGLEESTAIDLNELLRQEVELLRRTTLKKIQAILDLEEGLPVIQGAGSELGSAIMNLSVNALDAMPEGGTLTFRSRTLPDGRIELSVVDTGTGMGPEVLAKAMEPFFTTKPLGKGTGLGLPRVYGTVRAHGGTMEILSSPGAGTTVILRLPARSAGSSADPSQGQLCEQAPRKALAILLVDDEPIILDTISAMLESLGHLVETAALGEEALRRLDAQAAFDLVILDHNMPGLTGAQTLVRLRDSLPGLPVILSTGYMDARTEELLARIPRVWVLKKPYNRRDLQKLLVEILGNQDEG